MHRILLREVVIDAPSATFPAVRDFWAAALLTEARQVERYPEFTALEDPAALSVVGLQDVGADRARFHLDLETDDVPAEVARLVRLGAEEVSRGRTWVVLRDPAGLLLCVVPAETADFAERSRPVDQAGATPGRTRPMPYAFRSALRGYDIRQVDQLLETAERALASGRELDRESAQKALRAAEFPLRLRGYDRAQVNRFIDDLIRELGAHP